MNMKQKSPDQKRTRRNRYINAIEPFRIKYKCTAAEVYGIIQGVESRNAEQAQKIIEKNEKLIAISKKAKEIQDKISDAEIFGLLEELREMV